MSRKVATRLKNINIKNKKVEFDFAVIDRFTEESF